MNHRVGGPSSPHTTKLVQDQSTNGSTAQDVRRVARMWTGSNQATLDVWCALIKCCLEMFMALRSEDLEGPTRTPLRSQVASVSVAPDH